MRSDSFHRLLYLLARLLPLLGAQLLALALLLRLQADVDQQARLVLLLALVAGLGNESILIIRSSEIQRPAARRTTRLTAGVHCYIMLPD